MTSSKSEKVTEVTLRAALSTLGSQVGCAKGPYPGYKTKAYAVRNTISLAWRIGRAIAISRARNDLDRFADAIINEVGGKECAKVLFKGKIVGVERKTVGGHVYGEVFILSTDPSHKQEPSSSQPKLKIPFKNENLMASILYKDGDGIEKEKVIATVPDLICVCDSSSGEAVGTPEYRYGVFVTVIGITGSDRWTSTPRGLEIGGPAAFQLDVEYTPIGKSFEVRSVIDEFMIV
jgi:DUF917 family protein